MHIGKVLCFDLSSQDEYRKSPRITWNKKKAMINYTFEWSSNIILSNPDYVVFSDGNWAPNEIVVRSLREFILN